MRVKDRFPSSHEREVLIKWAMSLRARDLQNKYKQDAVRMYFLVKMFPDMKAGEIVEIVEG